jgi:hypothetical protein
MKSRNLRIYGREESKCDKRTYKYTIQHRPICLGEFVRRYSVHFVSVFLNKMAEMLYPIHDRLSELAYNPCAVYNNDNYKCLLLYKALEVTLDTDLSAFLC